MTELWRAFLRGLASCLDLSTTPPARSYKSDAEAIRSDWEKVGGDMRRAMEKVAAENATEAHTAEDSRDGVRDGKSEKASE